MNLNFCWTTLRVSNIEKSLKFYHEILGLPISSRHGGHGSEVIMLGKEEQPKIELLYEEKGAVLKENAGVSVGFYIESLEETINHFKSASIPVSEIIAPGPNVRFFFVKDPDGFLVQLVEGKN